MTIFCTKDLKAGPHPVSNKANAKEMNSFRDLQVFRYFVVQTVGAHRDFFQLIA